MTNEEFIREMSEGKAHIKNAIDHLNDVLCFLVLEDKESEEARPNLIKVVIGIQELKMIYDTVEELDTVEDLE